MTRRGLAAIAMIACSGRPTAAPTPMREHAAASAGTVVLAPGTAWQDRFDLDGDGVRDRVEVAATGGASCCYALAVISGRGGQRTVIPFELDGGYVGGLDLSQPEHFAIEVAPSGVARLVLEIATYNGEPQPIPQDWAALGVRSHRVAVTLTGGLRVENLGWSCERALTVIRRELWLAWEGLPGDCSVASALDALDAVVSERRLSSLGSERRPVMRYQAMRTADETTVIAYAEPKHAGTAERLVRIDLVSPRIATGVAATLAAIRHEPLGGGSSYWSVGLAIVVDQPGGAPASLALVPAGDTAHYLRQLARTP